MKAELWQEVEWLLHEASKLQAHERAAFIAGIADAQVQAEVRSLLAVNSDPESSRIGTVIGDAARAIHDNVTSGRPVGHFRIIREIGRGGMGELYLAHDLRLGRDVALKLLPAAFLRDKERLSRFEREARAAAALNHPNIVTVYEVGEWEGQPYIATEFIEGETLAQKLSRGPLTAEETAQLGAQIADALATAHRAGIIHRDLKPANIMLRPDGTLKVLDFGLARLLNKNSDAGEIDTQTGAGRILGTLAYMSPEQARAQIVDSRSDLWSLGTVLFELLSGTRPFAGDSDADLLAAILAHDPKPLRTMNRSAPAELESLISKLLVKDREQRCYEAADVARILRRFSKPQPVRSRWNKWLAASVVLVLSVAVASGWLVYRWSERQRARFETIPLARTLIDEGDYVSAFREALKAAQYIPNAPALQHLWPEVSQILSVRSNPPGTEVTWKPYADIGAPWQHFGRTPLNNVRVPKGPVRIQVKMAGYEAIEVAVDQFSSLSERPSEYNFTLRRAGGSMARMIHGVPSGATLYPSAPREAFDIDRYEVTNREFQNFVNRGGYRNRAYWKTPFVKDSRTISWEEAMAQFVDATGRPGPSTWEAGTYPPGQENYPVSGVSWYEAAAYAEFAGKSLPTVAHWLRASNLSGPYSDYRFLIPLSNFNGAHSWAVGSSGGVNSSGLYDVAGNVREWCWNESGGLRSIMGGSWADQSSDARPEDVLAPFDRSPTNGFRCAKYNDPGRA